MRFSNPELPKINIKIKKSPYMFGMSIFILMVITVGLTAVINRESESSNQEKSIEYKPVSSVDEIIAQTGNGIGNNTSPNDFDLETISDQACIYNDLDSYKSCETLTFDQWGNGNVSEDSDKVEGSVRIVPVPGVPGQWKVEYAITEHLLNFPLLNYFSSVDPEGTDIHPYVPESVRDQALNFLLLEDYYYSTGIYLEPNYNRRIEGIAKVNNSVGEDYILPVPNLGSASASAEVWYDFDELADLHLGLFLNDDYELPTTSNTGQVDPETDNQTDQRQFNLLKWLESIITGGEISPDTAEEIAEETIGFDVCDNVCLTDPVAVSRCNNADTVVLPKEQYEVVTEHITEEDQTFSGQEICDNLFGYNAQLNGDLYGGSCTITTDLLGTIIFDYFQRSNQVPVNLCQSILGEDECTEDQNITYLNAYRILRSEGEESNLDVGSNVFLEVESEQSNDVYLDNMLKLMERTWETQQIAVSLAGSDVTEPNVTQKVCHYENVGIEIRKTRTIYDANASLSTVGSNILDNVTSFFDQNRLINYENVVDDNIFFTPPLQDFEFSEWYSEPGRETNQCSNVKYQTLNDLPGDNTWRIARSNKLTDSIIVNSNSQKTVSLIYPWLGKIPDMWARSSFWLRDQLNPDLQIESSNENLGNTQSEAEKVTLDFCKDLIGSDEDPSITGAELPTEDCICPQSWEDPLEEYLIDNGMLKDVIRDDENSEEDIPPICIDYFEEEISGDQCYATDIATPEGIEDFQRPYLGPDKPLTQCFGPTRQKVGSDSWADWYDSEFTNSSKWTNASTLASLQNTCSQVAVGCIFCNIPYIYSSQLGASWFHRGTDIAMPTGTVLYPVAPGIVERVTKQSTGYGNNVIIMHQLEDGTIIYSRYNHLSRIDVTRGEVVDMTTIIGLSGNTGNSTGPHLDFELFYDTYTATTAYQLNIFENSTPLFINGPRNNDVFSEEPNLPIDNTQIDGNQTTVDENIESTESTDNTQNSCVVTVDEFCEDYRDSYDSIVGNPGADSDNSLLDLFSIAADSINSHGQERITPELIYAITKQETGLVCSKTWDSWRNGDRSACTGDPNQTAFASRNGFNSGAIDVRGITQFRASTFNNLIQRNTFANNREIMTKCLQDLGVDNTINNNLWRDPLSFSPQEFSRHRVGDAICAAGLKLSEDVRYRLAGNVYDNFLSIDEWDNQIFQGGAIDHVATQYHGSCRSDAGFFIDPVFGYSIYCINVRNNYRSALEVNLFR